MKTKEIVNFIMMRSKQKKMLLLFALSSTMGFAQNASLSNHEVSDIHRTTVVYGRQQIDSLVAKALMKNAPNYFNAPGMPQFAVIGKDRKFYFGIGGYVKGTLSYDWGNPIVNADHFTTSAIPMNQAKGNEGLVQLSAATSTIAFNFVGLPGTKHEIGAYFNLDFSNPNNGLFLMNAYATYAGFKAGYAFSLFTDLAAGPPTIDFEGPNGWTLVPNAVLDYEYQWGKHWGVGVGLELPVASYTTGGFTYAVNQRVPDIPAYIQYSWNKRSSWVRLSGLMRNMLYHDVVSGDNRNSTGWGVKASGMTVFHPKLTAFYQGAYGKGISSYFQDISGMQLDMVPTPDRDGRLSNVKSWGGYVGLQYNFTPTVFASATYSCVRTENPSGYYAEGQYKNAQYVATNLFWNLAKNVQMGVEYLWGSRENVDHVMKHDNRLQTMLQVNF